MGYSMLKNSAGKRKYTEYGLEASALKFIRDCCEDLRFDQEKAKREETGKKFLGSSMGAGQIPYNMQMDIDRLCLENALERFLNSGKKEDAFNVYFCYLEMFVGEYEKTRRMIELLSEFEANGSGLLMKHRDHYSHSVYVFALGLAIYQSNSIYRDTYKKKYNLTEEHQAACHYLRYWGLASLFHDIGYPFELPFEQVASYFEAHGEGRESQPFMAYHTLEPFTSIDEAVKDKLGELYGGKKFATTNELFAYALTEKLGEVYGCDEKQMLSYLEEKPTQPDKFNYFMDHAYFSATVLFKKLFEEMECELGTEYLDSLTAILMHNSLYKFCIANPNMDPERPGMHVWYKGKGNIPFQAKLHPLAYMLMLCDELQCWDRTAYGRNSKNELHPMGCAFDFSGNGIKADYLFDEKEISKINSFKDEYIDWLSRNKEGEKAPKLKAYSGMYIKSSSGISGFQEDIERIVDLTEIKLTVGTGITANIRNGRQNYLSSSNFMNLYNFAMVLNGRWNCVDAWRNARKAGQEEKFLTDKALLNSFGESFKALSLEYKLYNINQAKAFARYLNEIGCFYTDKAVDFELLDGFTKEELLKIGVLEHQRWLQEHTDMGWEYGTPDRAERELVRQHKDMIPGFDKNQEEVSEEQAKENYRRLDKEEQDKDMDPMECMLAMLKLFDGLRIYRLNL